MYELHNNIENSENLKESKRNSDISKTSRDRNDNIVNYTSNHMKVENFIIIIESCAVLTACSNSEQVSLTWSLAVRSGSWFLGDWIWLGCLRSAISICSWWPSSTSRRFYIDRSSIPPTAWSPCSCLPKGSLS